jgi:hypothetical protein
MANQHAGVEIEEIDANELEGDSDVDYEEEEAYTEEEEEELEDGQIEAGVLFYFSRGHMYVEIAQASGWCSYKWESRTFDIALVEQ